MVPDNGDKENEWNMPWNGLSIQAFKYVFVCLLPKSWSTSNSKSRKTGKSKRLPRPSPRRFYINKTWSNKEDLQVFSSATV